MTTVEKVAREVSFLLGDEYEVSAHTTIKNNGVELEGILIRLGEDSCAPVIYIDQYEACMDPASEAERIVSVYQETANQKRPLVAGLKDPQYVLANVRYMLIGEKQNAYVLSKYVCRKLCDGLVAIYYIQDENNNEAIVKVTHSFLASMPFSEIELDEAARRNTIADGIQFADLNQLIMDMANDEDNTKTYYSIDELPYIPIEFGKMAVLTNGKRTFGSALLLYPELLEKIADIAGGDFFIVPSSIHEVILVMAREGANVDADELTEYVKEVNATEVDEQERLADHVFRYCAMGKRIIPA